LIFQDLFFNDKKSKENGLFFEKNIEIYNLKVIYLERVLFKKKMKFN